ncbi:MAG: hypothetical protein KC619_09575 [Myxococcales bacterium]|nr:hypothetical protein [Myxococcales bacterium]
MRFTAILEGLLDALAPPGCAACPAAALVSAGTAFWMASVVVAGSAPIFWLICVIASGPICESSDEMRSDIGSLPVGQE